jgi:hypothetical protein
MQRLLLPLLVLSSFLANGQDSLRYDKGRIFLLKNVTFETGKSMINLDGGSQQELNRLVVAMHMMPGMVIQIEGHTDPAGDARLNKKLSEDRAEKIKYYLMGLGIEGKRIKVIGWGGTLALGPKGDMMNRRIEMRILENPTPLTFEQVRSGMSAAALDATPNKVTTPTPVQKKSLVKVGLLIGNSAYQEGGKLKNPVNDVELMARTLRGLDFDVSVYKNVNYKDMMSAIREFTRKLGTADIVFFYYAGHGLQYQGSNYLLPVDLRPDTNPAELPFSSINAEIILKSLEYTNRESLNIIVLDACRNNPYSTGTRSNSTGLTELKPPSGSLLAYATSPGSVAFDGTGENGVYTAALVEELQKSQRLEDVFMNTRLKVEQNTKGSQSPWELMRLRGVYRLKE